MSNPNNPQPCGTPAAYRRHKRKGEEPCNPCREAAQAKDRARYKRTRYPSSESDASKIARAAHFANRPGRRSLVARTCIQCGQMKPASGFRGKGPDRWDSRCGTCLNRRPAVKRAVRAYGKTSDWDTSRSRQPWMEMDFKILCDDALTLRQKAILTHRTFSAVSSKASIEGAVSAFSPDDDAPTNGVWMLQFPEYEGAFS